MNRSAPWPLLLVAFLCDQCWGAATPALVVSKNPPLCSGVLADIQSQLKQAPIIGKSTFAAAIDWRHIEYPFVGFGGQRNLIAADVAEFDIDNDGKKETLLMESDMLESESGDELFVFKDRPAPNSQQLVTYQERITWDGINSMPPWPYLSQGLSLIQIQILSYAGRNYLLLTDVHFGRKRGAAVVVAEYRGIAIKGAESHTDDFATICRIVQK